MIYNALNTITKKINEYLNLKYSSDSNYLELCNLIDHTGGLAVVDPNKIIATLVNIERETAMGINHRVLDINQGKNALSNPPVYINFYVLFSSVYTGDNYTEGLKFIASIIDFFQTNLIIDHANAPMLNSDIEKLIFEIVNLDFQSLSQLWGIIGGKYMPSVLYKVRMLSFNPAHIKQDVSTIKQPNINIQM